MAGHSFLVAEERSLSPIQTRPPILEGGHWCPECERKSWNYGRRAKVDPFFAQVWDPLHEPGELREYPKIVSELDV